MTFTKQDLGKKLKLQISLGRNANQIAKWTYCNFLEYCRDLNPELKVILEILLIMEAGPEFEFVKKH